MREICEGVYCVDCPMLALLDEEFTDQDRRDAFNSMILLRSTFKQNITRRFNSDEVHRLAFDARQLGHYSNEFVSGVAVRALEKQVSGTCELLKRGE